ncbi:uncharacterized protein BDZ99DRAFT_460923 [Mytilinidion resinicola]|uniref:Uncharacterized protein n=1 Tax=Mytilinidion resinicola TaxID=574789 RepID=A0A6A6YUD0_9PEZI|nr:uncharacterized protein BDZ99DRAFT_460923 [Mytilinidion resinicola]KAF2812148.1 hypothetical protein BDZ99DRAFT_460923 [Mytilinidion resinicola]
MSSLPQLPYARWPLDYFTLSYLISVIIVTIVVSSACAAPSIRQASLPQSLVLYATGIQLLLVNILHLFAIRTPVRFSSTSRGSELPPGTFVNMEDVVAVEGGGA